MAAGKKGGLGRGLDALFADAVPVYDEAGAVKAQAKDTEKKGKAEHTAGEKSENDGVRYIKIHDIMPNLNNRVKPFLEDKLKNWRPPSRSMVSFSRSLSGNRRTVTRS